MAKKLKPKIDTSVKHSEPKERVKTSKTVIIKRSEINFASYNPRKQDPKVIEAIRKNFKKVGYLGGIVFNKTTGNLVGGHKRVQALDTIYNYNSETKQNNYDIKVEQVELDEKTEKEQNIFLNNKRVQGETDYELLALILPDIDIENTGLTDYDLKIVESFVSDFKMGDNELILEGADDLKKSYDEKKQEIKDLKKALKEDVNEVHRASYFTITFGNYNDKASFLESYGIDGDSVFIKGEDFAEKIQSE